MFVAMSNVADLHRVHVMYVETAVDLVTLYAEVTSVVPSNHVVSNLLPLT
jgi:hypothetical protein